MLQLPTETKLNHPKGRPVSTVCDHDLEIFSKCCNQWVVGFCELQKNKLCTLLSKDPKIKVVPHITGYNFALVTTCMHSLYHMVQTWSNIVHSNDDLNKNYDLVTYLALAMNTKVVHNDTLNMFKLLARSYNHFMYQLLIVLSRSTHEILSVWS